MKIIIEPYSGGTYTAENDAEHISKVVNMFKGLLVQVGYHPQTVDNLFNEDTDTWFPEAEPKPEENDVTLPPEWYDENATDKKFTTKPFSKKKEQVDKYLDNLYGENFD